MATLTTPLAPQLTGTLSAEVEQLVRERVSTGGLSAYACRDVAAIRRSPAERDRDTAMRPAFVRDAEKIVHLPAYNRLGGKTQVFSFRADDDLCRRGLHVQLVARVARDIGRALGLNLDLIEAIALGHDLGHTPFGHAGERYLNQAFNRRCDRWFFHNVQSVRVLDVLGGRNVSLQVLDGTLCHNGEFEQQVFETSGLAEFDTFDRVVDSCWRGGEQAIAHLRPMTLEGCVVRVSDIIAYVGKDRQDAIAAGFVTEDSFDDGLGGAYNSWALGAFITDIIEHSFGRDRIEMSEEEVTERILSMLSGVEAGKIRFKGTNREERALLEKAAAELAGLPLRIVYCGSLAIDEIRAVLMTRKARRELDIFFIDYLNLIHIPYTRGSRNETTDLALGDVVRKVKLMAVELDVPAVLLAQMNRDSDRRLAPYLPILSDLRNSGAIEQVADQVIFVYRAEKYGILYDKDTKEDLRGVGYLLVAKNRNGATGRARFRYNVSMTRFLSYENRLL